VIIILVLYFDAFLFQLNDLSPFADRKNVTVRPKHAQNQWVSWRGDLGVELPHCSDKLLLLGLIAELK